MTEVSSALECPVCKDYFVTPKLLPCNHVTCSKCVTEWLKKTGPSGECPLCRAPILSPAPSSQEDLGTLVEALPTELTIMARVESSQLLSSRDVCMSCDSNMASVAFCLQCKMKLCRSCTNAHTKFPIMKNHQVEELSNMTAEQLAALRRAMCKGHEDLPAEHYCSTHKQLICLLCSSTDHRTCREVKAIEEAASEKRGEFRREAQRLSQEETAMKREIQECKDKLGTMRSAAKEVTDELHQLLDKRHQEVQAMIQEEEDKIGLKQWEQVRAAMASQARMLSSLVTDATDDVLLDMEQMVMSRLRHLGQQCTMSSTHNLAPVIFDSNTLTQLKSAISALGQRCQPSSSPIVAISALSIPTSAPSVLSSTSTVTPTKLPSKPTPAPDIPTPAPATSVPTPTPTPTPTLAPTPTPASTPASTPTPAPTSTPAPIPILAPPRPASAGKPRWAELAQVLKVGDRVKWNPHYNIISLAMGLNRRGTVTAIPSTLLPQQGRSPAGYVDVLWDGGRGVNSHCMGANGRYELDLA